MRELTMTESLMMAFETLVRVRAAATPSRETKLILDARDAPGFASGGELRGAANMARGMLEFQADPGAQSQFRMSTEPERIGPLRSSGRAALRGKTLKDLGYGPVYNVRGLKGLADAGFGPYFASPLPVPPRRVGEA